MPEKASAEVTSKVLTALNQFNQDYGVAWTLGENWSNVGTQFETFINKYLFPKLNETRLIQALTGNRFDWLAREVDFVGQYSEEYVILDSVPVNMNLSKDEILMLKRNYPKMATKLYGSGIVKKRKFTLNNNDVRLNWLTLKDGVTYALGVYKKEIQNIDVSEEREIKGLIVNYANTFTKDVRLVTSEDELFNKVSESILNLQNNNHKYNESDTASNGTMSTYTTRTPLQDVAILTTDYLKSYLLNTKLANTFQVAGIDLTSKIISFDDLGGVFKLNSDYKLVADDVLILRNMGDYQAEVGDTIPEGAVFTIDTIKKAPMFKNMVEVKPDSDLWAYVFDINKLRYLRYTKDMIKPPFYNGEFDEVTYWLHYYTNKLISPFYNNVLVKGDLRK